MEVSQDDLIAREALGRIKLFAPIGVLILITALLVSESYGVPIVPGVYTLNAITGTGLVLIAYALLTGRVPNRIVHPIAALGWFLLPLTTLVTYAWGGRTQLGAAIAVALFAAPAVVVAWRWVAVSTTLVTVGWVAVTLRQVPETGLGYALVPVITTWALANLIAVGQWILLRDGARYQAELASSNAKLSRELAERRRAEVEREKFRDQFVAAQRSEAIGSLAAGIAHEMNNVLAGILTAAELLLDEEEPQARRDLNLDLVKEARRGGALTHSLLAFARRGQYRRTPAPFGAMVDEVARLLPRTLPRTISFSQTGGTEVLVDVDRAQVTQAILNLAINGADAMPHGGRLTIHTTDREVGPAEAEALRIPPGHYAVVTVKDSGDGMDEPTRRRAFEPFFTTKEQGKGTGLGLAMVKGAVEAHDGAASISSTPGAGTEVALYLPVFAGEVAPVELAEVTRIAGRGRVLVVDDEPLIRASLSKVLVQGGFFVETASNGKEGLEAFERDPNFSVVLCDMNMPVMNGAALIRAIHSRSSVPILIISGFAVEEEAQALIREGIAGGFLEKPFTADALRRAIEAISSRTSAEDFPVMVHMVEP